MALPYFEYNGLHISAIGLGCSRLGSIMGSSMEESERVILSSIDHGITFFDTASSYGQGDSERILGRIVVGNDQICLVTKIGKKVPLKAKLLQPFKGIIRKFARRSGKAGNYIKKSRGGALPVCFDNAYLQSELDKSRRRLGLDCIPVVMLHSPTVADLLKGDATEFLDKARERGALRVVGAAVDDLEAAEATLKDHRIKIIQTPFYENDKAMADWALRAKKAGKIVVAREIFHGLQGIGKAYAKEHIRKNLRRVLNNDDVGVSLVGTTNPAHLSELLEIAKSELNQT